MNSILKNIFLLIVFALITFSFTKVKKKPQITNLKCEYLINPICIDSQIPRFNLQLLNEETCFLYNEVRLLESMQGVT